MRKLRYWSLVALGVALGFVVLYFGFRDSKDRWVAFGTILSAEATLALAILTFRSVTVTAEVLRGDERRHQQRLCPFLRAEFVGADIPPDIADAVPEGATTLVTDLRLTSCGLGPALFDGITLNGRYSCVSFDTAAKRYTAGTPRELTLPIGFPSLFLAPATPNAEYTIPINDFRNKDVAGIAGVLSNLIAVESLEIRYRDVFDNSYRTEYVDIPSQQSIWHRPEVVFPDQSRIVRSFGRATLGLSGVLTVTQQRPEGPHSSSDDNSHESL